MNKEELAEKLNGIEYPMRGMRELCDGAKEAGLVVVVGYSDDGTSFYGAINEQISAWDDTVIFFTQAGLYIPACDDEACPHEQKLKAECKIIKALWEREGYSWIYETDIPHACFDVVEGEDKYCRGIVFEISKLLKERVAKS